MKNKTDIRTKGKTWRLSTIQHPHGNSPNIKLALVYMFVLLLPRIYRKCAIESLKRPVESLT